MENEDKKRTEKLPKWAMTILGVLLILNGVTLRVILSMNREITNLNNNINHIQISVNTI